MGVWDIVILCLVGLAVGGAVFVLIRSRKRRAGGCSCCADRSMCEFAGKDCCKGGKDAGLKHD